MDKKTARLGAISEIYQHSAAGQSWLHNNCLTAEGRQRLIRLEELLENPEQLRESVANDDWLLDSLCNLAAIAYAELVVNATDENGRVIRLQPKE